LLQDDEYRLPPQPVARRLETEQLDEEVTERGRKAGDALVGKRRGHRRASDTREQARRREVLLTDRTAAGRLLAEALNDGVHHRRAGEDVIDAGRDGAVEGADQTLAGQQAGEAIRARIGGTRQGDIGLREERPELAAGACRGYLDDSLCSY
jgi:hypothetical protein